jgi:hypothetical protein
MTEETPFDSWQEVQVLSSKDQIDHGAQSASRLARTGKPLTGVKQSRSKLPLTPI